MSVERLERSTNGLKGQKLQHASPIQWPALFAQFTGQIFKVSQRKSVQETCFLLTYVRLSVVDKADMLNLFYHLAAE
jgi:hypothetical protein